MVNAVAISSKNDYDTKVHIVVFSTEFVFFAYLYTDDLFSCEYQKDYSR